jgi:hypothetical protein
VRFSASSVTSSSAPSSDLVLGDLAPLEGQPQSPVHLVVDLEVLGFEVAVEFDQGAFEGADLGQVEIVEGVVRIE